ncbi:hypothetical protein ACO0LF_02850 [Undibacterium sp. Di27W]|uniref:hypothetical protein n=1 Tax=Undibacterium sp. Di27W TaxID=3413036 RepID=UPI003BF088B1
MSVSKIHLLIPDKNAQDFQSLSTGPYLIDQDIWALTKNVELGGVFVDYIRDACSIIVGVRYWLMDDVSFDRHRVFTFFLNDSRFFFNQAEFFVNILFDEKNIADFKKNLLLIDSAQDLGRDSVITNGNKYGIAFEIDARAAFD